MSTEKYTVDHAVQHALDEITDAQVALKILDHIVTYLRNKRTYARGNDELDNSISCMRLELYKELEKAWNGLSFFGTVNLRAKKALHERAKSWFNGDNHEVMSFVGESGSHWVSDEEKFRRKLKEAFGIFGGDDD